MRIALAMVLFVPAAASADPAKESRLTVSQNGAYAVKMTEVAPEQCRLDVLKDNQPLWSLDKCVGSSDDLYFVSNDGGRVWVLRTAPEKPGPPKGRKKGTPWYQVEVATLYDGQGQVVQSRRLMDVVPAPDREKVRQLGKHFIWLEGVSDMPGKKPRVNDAGQVEFEVAGSHSVKLNF